jgi:hypothetical protein
MDDAESGQPWLRLNVTLMMAQHTRSYCAAVILRRLLQDRTYSSANAILVLAFILLDYIAVINHV